jgi:hypothetical protein
MESATTTVKAATTTVKAVAYVATATSPATMAVAPTATIVIPAIAIAPAVVIPRASADKEAAIEPIRAVVSIGCTRVRRICVVAVLADRRSVRIAPTDLNPK